MSKNSNNTLRKWSRMAIAVIIAGMITPAAASAQILGEAPWSETYGESELTELHVDFVRGSAAIIRRPGPVSIEIQNLAGTDPEGIVWLGRSLSGKKLVLTDIYPKISPWNMRRECLPLDPVRGNFWTSKAKLRVKVFAPVEMKIGISFMDGHEVSDSQLALVTTLAVNP